MVRTLVKCPICKHTKITERKGFYCCRHSWITERCLDENEELRAHRTAKKAKIEPVTEAQNLEKIEKNESFTGSKPQKTKGFIVNNGVPSQDQDLQIELDQDQTDHIQEVKNA